MDLYNEKGKAAKNTVQYSMPTSPTNAAGAGGQNGRIWLLIVLIFGFGAQYFQLVRVNPGGNIMQDIINPSLKGGNSQQQQQATEEPRVGENMLAHAEKTDATEVIEEEPISDKEVAFNMPDPVTIPIVGNFDPAKFNYMVPAVPTTYTLPPPKRTNQTAVVIVLSARSNFERRAVIRETYAKDNDNVYFVIGGPVPSDVQDMDRFNPLSTSSMLFQEQEHFGDIISAIHPDTYKSLPYKLHFSVRWIMRNIENCKWIVKADDDQLVRVRLLQYFLLRKFNANHPIVIGCISIGSRPHTSGKWAEDPHFKENVYPPWAFGSAGYVISRPVAQYLADNDLYYYQGEDAGLGIWLSESPLQVTFIDSPELENYEKCHDRLYVIGHDLSVDAIRNCFNEIGDTIPTRPHIVAFSAARKDQFPHVIRHAPI